MSLVKRRFFKLRLFYLFTFPHKNHIEKKVFGVLERNINFRIKWDLILNFLILININK